VTKSEEYMFLLGQATAIADIYTLIESVPEPEKGEMATAWTHVMKKVYEQTDMWKKVTERKR
jgi:hypothetical protein